MLNRCSNYPHCPVCGIGGTFLRGAGVVPVNGTIGQPFTITPPADEDHVTIPGYDRIQQWFTQ